MTEAEILALLAKRYAAPVWAFLPQVRNGTGFLKLPRTADAIAMALWPSRGLELIGFEVKVHRADWLRELKDAEKAEDFFALCDRWYLVAPAEIVKPEELPASWGWMIPGPKGLTVKVAGEGKKGADPDRLFLAAILRRIQEATVPRDAIAAELAKAREQGRKEAVRDAGYDAEEHQRLLERVAAFEKASGVHLDAYMWRWDSIGRAVRQVLEHGPERIRQQIEAHRRWAAEVLQECDELLASEDAAPGATGPDSPVGEAPGAPEVSP